MTDTVALSSTYVFLPWVRQGAAAGIKTPDSLGADQAGVVSVPVTLRVNDTDEVTRQVRLYGPGDVTGIDPQQVVRTNPSHLARDFEPNYFPAVDFDRPDFPWLFTPAASGAGERLPDTASAFLHPSLRAAGVHTAPDVALPRLLAGLRVSDEDLIRLITTDLPKHLGVDPESASEDARRFALSAKNLSLLYRHARLAERLKLSIPKLFHWDGTYSFNRG